MFFQLCYPTITLEYPVVVGYHYLCIVYKNIVTTSVIDPSGSCRTRGERAHTSRATLFRFGGENCQLAIFGLVFSCFSDISRVLYPTK